MSSLELGVTSGNYTGIGTLCYSYSRHLEFVNRILLLSFGQMERNGLIDIASLHLMLGLCMLDH